MTTHKHRRDHDVNEIFGRLRTVEGELAGLRTEVATIAANMASQNAILTKISDAQDRRAGTDWKALAAWAAVVLAIVGTYTSQNISPIKEQTNLNTSAISRVVDRQAEASERAADQALERGRYVERVDNLAKQQEILLTFMLEERSKR